MSTLKERFWAKVRKGGPDECWPWLAGLDGHGYGAIKDGRSVLVASRVAWMIHTGASEMPPRHLDVMHSCDNPPCVNPAHLSLGTRLQNMADAVSKGRQARGERLPQSKVTEAVVRAIRARLASGERVRDVASALNVSKKIVIDVRRRRTWKHVD